MRHQIISNINYKTFFAVLLITTFPFIFMSIYFLYRFIHVLEYRFDTFLFIGTLVLIFITIIGLLFTISFFPKIEINDKEIIIKTPFKSRVILIENINSINLSYISTYYEILADQTTIFLKNKESIKLLPFKYSNFHIIRLALNQISTSLKSDKKNTINLIHLNQSIPKSDKYIIQKNSNYKIYNHPHILSLNGILFYFLLSAITYNLLKNNELFDYITFSLIVLVFLFCVFNMNYFIISDKHLIIKNSILFWKQTTFDLNQIKEIEIKSYFRKPGRDLIIKTNYFKTQTITSTNLTNKQWKLFNEDLKLHSIKIENFGSINDRKVYY